MKPPKVLLLRDTPTAQGTGGLLVAPGFESFSLELPWRGNASKVSCIPTGEYACAIRRSPRFGLVYEVQSVPGRSDILIHSGNFAGVVEAGLRSDVQGCILLGEKRGVMMGQKAVLVSRPAVRRFMQAMGGKPFTLEVAWNL
mgnify:CR=1 FL=1